MENSLADVWYWPEATLAFFTSGERLAKSEVPKPNLIYFTFCQGTALFAPNSAQAYKTYFCPVALEHMQLIGNFSGLVGQIKVRMERKGQIQGSLWRKNWECMGTDWVDAKEEKGLNARSKFFSLSSLGIVIITWRKYQPTRQFEEKYFRRTDKDTYEEIWKYMFNFTKLGLKVAFVLLLIFESNNYSLLSPHYLESIINHSVSGVTLDTYGEKVENLVNSL